MDRRPSRRTDARPAPRSLAPGGGPEAVLLRALRWSVRYRANDRSWRQAVSPLSSAIARTSWSVTWPPHTARPGGGLRVVAGIKAQIGVGGTRSTQRRSVSGRLAGGAPSRAFLDQPVDRTATQRAVIAHVGALVEPGFQLEEAQLLANARPGSSKERSMKSCKPSRAVRRPAWPLRRGVGQPPRRRRLAPHRQGPVSRVRPPLTPPGGD